MSNKQHFNANDAERVAEANNGKVSANMNYIDFAGYWAKARRDYFASQYNNVAVVNGTGSIAHGANPTCNSHYSVGSYVMIIWTE